MYIVDCKAGRSPAHEKKLKPINEGIKKMKKILAAMIIAVIAVAGVFATANQPKGPNKIQLDYQVKEIFLPAYGFLYGTDSTFSTDKGTYAINDGLKNQPTVATDNGIKANSVKIKLYDLSYSNLPAGTGYTMKVTIDPTATKWRSPATDGHYTSTTSTFTITSANNSITIDSNLNKGSDTVVYTNGLVDHTGTKQSLMGTFEISWLADPLAPAGKYTADIKVTCEAN